MTGKIEKFFQIELIRVVIFIFTKIVEFEINLEFVFVVIDLL